MSDSNKAPATRVRVSTVQASIWRNQTQDGKPFYSTTFDRRYTDKEGNWKSSTSFSVDELLLLRKVADLAHTEVMKLRAADRSPEQPDELDTAAA